ncbi:MAG: sodium:solute symporter family protein, partial [Methanobacteriaceae archaeon]|nr:sodium:solute symporter family protein [Methanobacteriaceae archaeon]
RATKEGAIAGLVVGTLTSLFWLILVHKKEAAALGISKALFGTDTLITSMPWPVVDPLVVALPLALAVTIIVSLMTKPPGKNHLKRCFNGIN